MNKYFALTLSLALLFSTGCAVPGWAQSFLEILLPVVATGLAGLITFGFAQLTSWLTSKAKSQKLDNAIVVSSEYLETMTTSMVEEYKDALVEALKDGKIDEQEKENLKDIALSTLKERFSYSQIKKLGKDMGLDTSMVSEYLMDKVTGLIGEKLDNAVTSQAVKLASATEAVSSIKKRSKKSTKKSTKKRAKRKSTKQAK